MFDGVGVLGGVRVMVGVPVGRGVRVFVGVDVAVGVRVGVSVGGNNRVGVTRTSDGYSCSMAEYQSRPPVNTNSVKRAPRKNVRQFGKAGTRSQPYCAAREVTSTQ